MDNPTTENPEPQESSNLSLLASEAFGSKFHGEVKEPEPDTSEEEPDTETELETTETETETELELKEEPTEEAEEEATTISSFEELVETQEWDKEWVDSLEIKVKVDGEEKPVKLADLRASYQMQEAAQKRLDDSKQKAQQVNEELTEKQQKINEQYTIAAKLIEKSEKALQSESEKIDWDDLKKHDPAEWSAKKLEIQERRQNLDALKDEAIKELQKAQSLHQEESQKVLAQVVQDESRKLVEKIPEWADQDKAASEKSQVAKYLRGLGFSDQEIASAYDHRMIVLARKAMLHDAKDKALEPAKKKFKKVVKSIPPGSKKSESQINLEEQNRLRSRLKQSGRIEDALAVLRSRTGT